MIICHERIHQTKRSLTHFIKPIRYGNRDLGGRKNGKSLIVEIKRVINHLATLTGKTAIETIFSPIDAIIIFYSGFNRLLPFALPAHGASLGETVDLSRMHARTTIIRIRCDAVLSNTFKETAIRRIHTG
ncbi:hypothetical protein DK52_3251 [Brucella abortus]|nr:hypothetical protein DK52_3251 [Brucella abortus]KFJ60670.1 hypothetical protein DK59_2824 [Brucella abortus bv. 4 str. 292]